MIQIKIANINDLRQNHFDKLVNNSLNKQTYLAARINNKCSSKIKFEKKLFYESLRNDINKSLDDSLLTCSPEKLVKYIEYYSFNFPFDFETDLTFRKELLDVFKYESYDNWGAYDLAKSLNLSVCHYCNRAYITTVGTDADKGTRPQFDHFFSQKQFPYLSMSFYNLIPSCYVCNSNLKGDAFFSIQTHLHPHIEGFDDDYKFSLSVKNVNFLNGKADSYDIKLKPKKGISRKKKWKCEEHIQVFRLEELYQYHKDYVDEIIIKSQIYTSGYIDSLYTAFKDIYFGSPSEAKRFVLGNYVVENKHGLRPLSKLTMDISKELKLI